MWPRHLIILKPEGASLLQVDGRHRRRGKIKKSTCLSVTGMFLPVLDYKVIIFFVAASREGFSMYSIKREAA